MSDAPLPEKIDFDQLANALAPLGVLNSPSELHGLLCGKLAGGAALSEVQWLLDAVEFLDFTQAPEPHIRDLLSLVYKVTQKQFHGDLVLTLLLPGDDELISDRVAALSQWCHGFLTGFGSAGAQNRSLDEEAQDMLRDLAAIVQIQVDDEEDEEANEADYMEVTEYVRVIASSLHNEFSAAPDKIIIPPVSKQIH
jgi:uncharacterized protein YgfB (UPF0149 family)